MVGLGGNCLFMAAGVFQAQAELIGRDLDGDADTIEAYYDTELDITWLADANLAASNTFGVAGISSGNAVGGMPWSTAHEWVNAMNSAAYLGITDWRLPNDFPIDREVGLENNSDNEGYFLEFSTNGISDGGYALRGEGWVGVAGEPASELGYLFYVTLNNLSACIPDLVTPIGDDLRCLNDAGDRTTWPAGAGLTNTGPFTNLDEAYYWAAQEDPRENALRGRGLNFTTGFRIALGKTIDRNRAWPVVSGDVGALQQPPPPKFAGAPRFVEVEGERKVILTLDGSAEGITMEFSVTLAPGSWIPVDAIIDGNTLMFDAPMEEQGFWRLAL